MCYSAAPSTTNQNATPKDIYKGYKVARKVLIGIHYKNAVQQYMKTANKTSIELFYALHRSRGHKEHLKRS